MKHTNDILRSYLVKGLADLVAAIVRPMYLQVMYSDTQVTIDDYSLSIDEHAAVIAKEIGCRYSVKVVKNQIIIK